MRSIFIWFALNVLRRFYFFFAFVQRKQKSEIETIGRTIVYHDSTDGWIWPERDIWLRCGSQSMKRTAKGSILFIPDVLCVICIFSTQLWAQGFDNCTRDTAIPIQMIELQQLPWAEVIAVIDQDYIIIFKLRLCIYLSADGAFLLHL